MVSQFSYSSVRSIGTIAAHLLQAQNRASVFGVTSRGIFLQSGGRWIVFLSRERFRGPLTLNIDPFPPTLHDIPVGAPVAVDGIGLRFESQELALDLRGVTPWEAPVFRQLPVDGPALLDRLAILAADVYSAKSPAGLSGLLPEFASIPGPRLDSYGVLPVLQQAHTHIRSAKMGELANMIARLLGLGVGLTPCGDDLILGLTLVLNRCRDWFPTTDVDLYNQRIVQAAREKTTMLSASLIECAAHAQADERLVSTLDAIVTGNADLADCARWICGWGSTSGADTLLGMALGITATIGYK